VQEGASALTGTPQTGPQKKARASGPAAPGPEAGSGRVLPARATSVRRRLGPAPFRPAERFWELLVHVAGISAILFVLAICLFLFREAYSLVGGFDYVGEAIRYPLSRLLGGTSWYPDAEPPRFGLLPLMGGTALVSAIAIAIAAPLGLMSATWLAEFCPRWIREIAKPAVELLAAIPSVVIGFFGLVALGPAVAGLFHTSSGINALTGGIALAIMAVPTIVSIGEDALQAVPHAYREASLALGADRWQTTWRVVLPAAAPGLLAAVILGVGRVVGETMAVLMVTGNAAVIPHSALDKVQTMTATIALEMGETVHGSPHYRALFAVGAVLFLASLAVNGAATWTLRRARARLEGRA